MNASSNSYTHAQSSLDINRSIAHNVNHSDHDSELQVVHSATQNFEPMNYAPSTTTNPTTDFVGCTSRTVADGVWVQLHSHNTNSITTICQAEEGQFVLVRRWTTTAISPYRREKRPGLEAAGRHLRGSCDDPPPDGRKHNIVAESATVTPKNRNYNRRGGTTKQSPH